MPMAAARGHSQHKEVLFTGVVVFLHFLGVQEHLPVGRRAPPINSSAPAEPSHGSASWVPLAGHTDHSRLLLQRLGGKGEEGWKLQWCRGCNNLS